MLYTISVSHLLPYQQIEQMNVQGMNLGPEASRLLATGLFTMPKLRRVDLWNKQMNDSFFLVMSELGHTSQVRTAR